jgi:hypothetical protein
MNNDDIDEELLNESLKKFAFLLFGRKSEMLTSGEF